MEPITILGSTTGSVEPIAYYLDYLIEGPSEISSIREEFSFTERDRNRLRDSHNEDINLVDVPTHEDILDQAFDTIKMLKSAAMDIDLNPTLAQKVMDYYAQLRWLEPGSYKYRWSDFCPHPEDPIKYETYDQLCSLIEEIQQSIGVSEKDHTYASAQVDNDSPQVDIYYHRGPKGLRIAGITLRLNRNEVNFSLRNDAGTEELPRQVAGKMNVIAKYQIIDDASLLTESDVTSLIASLRELMINKHFEKKTQPLSYMPH